MLNCVAQTTFDQIEHETLVAVYTLVSQCSGKQPNIVAISFGGHTC